MDHQAQCCARDAPDRDRDGGPFMLTATLFLGIHGAIWFAIGAAVAWWFLKP